MADASDDEPEPLTWLERLLAMAVRQSALQQYADGISLAAGLWALQAARDGDRGSLTEAMWRLALALRLRW